MPNVRSSRKAQEVLAHRNHKAGLVGPALLAWNWFGRSWFDRPLQNVKILSAFAPRVTEPRGNPLHYQREVLEFMLQYR